MRRLVVGAAQDGHLELEMKEVAELSERKYEKATGELGKSYHGKPVVNFKNAFKYFPRVFGSTWVPKLQGNGWDSFSKLLEARNAFTHPKEESDLHRGDVGMHVLPSVGWFLATFVEMMKSIGDLLGTNITLVSSYPSGLSDFSRAKIELIEPPPPPAVSLGELLREVKFMRLLAQDSRAAYDAFSRGVFLHSGRALVVDLNDFGARLYARFLFTEIEAFYYMARRLLEQSAERNEIAFAENEIENLATKDLLLKIARYAEAFSEKFGYGRSIDVSGRGWFAFSQFAGFRDRITHPKEVANLVVKVGTLDVIVDAMEWYMQFLDALELSEKYVNLSFR